MASRNGFAQIGGATQNLPLKVQASSAEDGTYVPVVALDADTGITIGTVNQGTSPWVVSQPDQVSSGTLNSATLNTAYTVNLANGEGIVGFNVSGLTASGATLTIEAQIGSASSWRPTNGFASSTGTVFTTLTTDQGFRVNVGGRTAIRLRVSSTGTGTITVASSAASVSDLVGISSPIPPGSNTIGTVVAPSVTPRAGTASTITTGGTAVTIVTGPCNGGYITNPINAAAQGISAAENVYLDPVNTPGDTDANANGTTILLEPGQNFSLPQLASGVALKANAASSGHKLTVVVW